MSGERDDYLWDRSGPAPPEIQRLEGLLSRYRAPRREPSRRLRPVALVAVAAAVLAAVALVAFRPAGNEDALAWEVAWEVAWAGDGERTTRLRVGEWLETDGARSATIAVADIGHVEVQPDSRIRLVDSGADGHRMQLARGRLHASVYAPPRIFVIDTPAARAVDLGCAYELEVDESGAGLLRVTSGHVELDGEGGVAFVPADALCPLVAGVGPGLPYFADAPAPLRALDPADADALARAVAAARPADTLTLWHALPRTPQASRRGLVERIAALAGIPPEFDRRAAAALEPPALAAWRLELERTW